MRSREFGMDYIKFLGANGAKTATKGPLSVLLDSSSVIDAGNIIMGLSDRAFLVDKIFLTHSHIDHICDIPFLIEERVVKADTPLKIYGLKDTLDILRESLFNNQVWPDFTKIKLLNRDSYSIELIEIELDIEYEFENFSIRAVKTFHTKGSCGYVVKKSGLGILITSDTYICDNIWQTINKDDSIIGVCIDISFPSKYAKLAEDSRHLTPTLLKDELKKLKRDISIYPIHLKPSFYEEIVEEINKLGILKDDSKIIQDGDLIYFKRDKNRVFHYEIRGKFDLIAQKIYDIAIALSTQKDTKKLLDMILKRAQEITGAEGGTIYMLNEEELSLEFWLVKNSILGVDGKDLNRDKWEPLPLYDSDRLPNRSMVAVVSAIEKRIINIDDVYETSEFDFGGTKEFDKKSNYRSKSMLVIPLLNHEDRVIGVLQLINKNSNSKVVSFDSFDEKITLALASIGATAITKDRLIKEMEILFESFLDTINFVIEKKSQHTAGHINRVVEIVLLLAKEISDDNSIFRDIHYSPKDIKELKLSALMHDIGKIGIAEHIMNKATKLQSIYDRVEAIEYKSQIRKNELLISYLKSLLDDNGIELTLPKEYFKRLKEIEEEMEFIRVANRGSENFEDEQIERVVNIAKAKITLNSKEINWLSDDEVKNLSIKRGTLNNYEKEIIKSHAKIGAEILETLPFPKEYQNVPLIATAHHEKLDGSGYPKGLKADDIRFEARILAIADIFEALISNNRPYKKSKSAKEAMEILKKMASSGQLDRDIVSFLERDELYSKIAQEVLGVGTNTQHPLF